MGEIGGEAEAVAHRVGSGGNEADILICFGMMEGVEAVAAEGNGGEGEAEGVEALDVGEGAAVGFDADDFGDHAGEGGGVVVAGDEE